MKNKFLILGLGLIVFLVFTALILTSIHKRPAAKKSVIYKGRIAIVIDDWGYHLDNLLIASQIKQPLTCAVLPSLFNSKLIAKKLNALGFEVILHLPMQPKEKYNLENNTITLGMSSDRVKEITNKGLNSVAFAKGISNHMGSAITEDEEIISGIMAVAKKRRLYFLDSYVTASSICSKVADKINIKFAKRDVFLDNQNDRAYIENQILKLKNLAKKYGSSIGIGHDRKNTLMVLRDVLPGLEKEGYKFVYVSEVAQ